VYFDYDQSNLTAKSIQALKGVSELMNRNSKISLSIEGHADERGTREYNLALGQRRAESVANYLVANGINRNRLITKSYGEERPLSLGSNNTAWSKNRRVEIK
jgi:peptidoglycan-associated lipoprotein